MAKTVAELREIVRVVKARGEVEPSDEELECDECPCQGGSCETTSISVDCTDLIAKWCDEQATQGK